MTQRDNVDPNDLAHELDMVQKELHSLDRRLGIVETLTTDLRDDFRAIETRLTSEIHRLGQQLTQHIAQQSQDASRTWRAAMLALFSASLGIVVWAIQFVAEATTK